MCLATHGINVQATGVRARGLDDSVQLAGLRQLVGLRARFGGPEDRAIDG
jgi:hypothetical protein